MSVLRRSARPIGVLVLALLVAPARPADCLGLAGRSHEQMPCCSSDVSAGAALEGGCCNIREGTSLPDRGPVSTASAPRAGTEAAAPAAAADAHGLPSANSRHDASACAADLSPDPLYLRLSVIRR